MRTYLFVPPEEKIQAQALGALWDNDSKRWYIEAEQASANFSRWLPESAGNEQDTEDPYTVVSGEAFVAEATVPCQKCGSGIQVICVYCESGQVAGEPLERFTVSHIYAMDDTLADQLHPWQNFKKVASSGTDQFANHCPHCGAPQDELHLHTEPEEPFFDIPSIPDSSIRMTPLAGVVHLSGDEHHLIG